MRTRRDPKSPWGRRIWLDDYEFEQRINALLSRCESGRYREGYGVDVEAILLELDTEPDYIELPSGVLGRTNFSGIDEPTIQISASLAEMAQFDNVQRRRLRSTIAHEIAHIVFHHRLYQAKAGTLSFFPEQPTVNVVCREDGSSDLSVGKYNGEWWEYQANQGMACLLLPRQVFLAVSSSIAIADGFPTIEEALRAIGAMSFVRKVADSFDVNSQMVFYRFQKLLQCNVIREASLKGYTA